MPVETIKLNFYFCVGTKLYAYTILTNQVIDYQTYAIGKAIRPLFADRVTINVTFLCGYDFTDEGMIGIVYILVNASGNNQTQFLFLSCSELKRPA